MREKVVPDEQINAWRTAKRLLCVRILMRSDGGTGTGFTRCSASPTTICVAGSIAADKSSPRKES